MRIDLKTTTILLALLAGTACAAGPAVTAFADTGGSSAAPASATPATTNIRSTGIATWFGPGFYGKRPPAARP